MESDQKKVRWQCLRGPALSLRHFPSSLFKVTNLILTPFGKPVCGWVEPPTVHVSGSQISISVTKYPPKNNLKEESFILAPGFRDFCPCLLGTFVLGTVLKQNVTTEGMVEYRSSTPAPEKNEGEGRKGKERGEGKTGKEREFECSWTRFLIYSSHAPSGPLSRLGPASQSSCCFSKGPSPGTKP